MRLTQSLHKGLRECAGRTAAICAAERTTYRELHHRVARLAGALQRLGVAPNDRVGMLALNSTRYLEFFYGAWWAGAAINPVNVRWTAREVAFSLDDCDTRVLLIDDTFVHLAPELRTRSASLKTLVYCGRGSAPEGMLDYEILLAEAEPVADAHRANGDLAAVLYTGGTTGQPKGVMLSHANLYLNTQMGVGMCPRDDVRTTLVAAPMFHVAGCGLAIQTMWRQGTQVFVPGFDELSIMGAIQEHGVNELFMVPLVIQRIVDHPQRAHYDLRSVKVLLYGAAPIDAALLRRAMAALPQTRFNQLYGMTEVASIVSLLGAEDHRRGLDDEALSRSAGRALSCVDLRIVDGEGQECAPGRVGEIVVGGGSVMLGYWNRPAETSAALRDGWMFTGDGGYLDSDGYLYVVDRLKDMIVTGGENVYSGEVENVIAQIPAVQLCAVIGVPDERWGERVHAVIVLRPDAELTAEQVIAHCKEHIAGYKCPRSVEFRREMPVSAAGKLQKAVLRAPYWADRSRSVN